MPPSNYSGNKKKTAKTKKNKKKIKLPTSTPDTSCDGTQRGKMSSYCGGKELRIDKLLEKKKEIKEKDVFNFSEKQIQVK